MSREYLSNPNQNPNSNMNMNPQPPKRDSKIIIILLSLILVLVLAAITAFVLIAIKSKDENKENPSESQSVVVTEQTNPHKTGGLPQAGGELPSIEITQTTPVEACPICGSTDFNAPDGEGYKSCKKCDTKWKENGDKILVVQDGEKTEIPATTTTTTTTTTKSRTTTTKTTPTIVTRPPTTTSTTTKPPSSKVKVGDYIKLGKYEQDNNTSNGKEAIEWLVLDVQGDKALVISRYAFDGKTYHNTTSDITWEKCTLRSWLNNNFYNSAFTSSEKSRIKTTTVMAEDNPESGTEAGNNTHDKVFLLSYNEAKRYFASDSARTCKPTAYAKAQGVWFDSAMGTRDDGNCEWLLRTPGDYNWYVCVVEYYGAVYSGGYDVNKIYYGIRPAMWISV